MGELVDHWRKECKEYILRCNDCNENFNDKDEYYEHVLLHRTRDDTLKRRYHFGNVHSDQHRNDYCDDKSIQLATKCKICQQLYMCKKSEHQCPKECIDWGYFNKTNVCKLCNNAIPIGHMKEHLEIICVNQSVLCSLCNKQVIRKNMVKHWKIDCDGYQINLFALSMMRRTIPSLNGRDIIGNWIKYEIENKHQLIGHIPSEIHLLIVMFYAGNHDFTDHSICFSEKRWLSVSEWIKCDICTSEKFRTSRARRGY